MSIESFQEMYAYNFWANRQVWSCIEQLSEEQFTQDSGYAHGSLRAQSIHIMDVEWWWLHFLATGELSFLNEDDYVTRADVRRQWDLVEKAAMAYIQMLTPAKLERDARPEFWREERKPIKVWQALFQVANHSTDHRAQMLAAIHEMGGATIEQDYLNYAFEQQSQAK